LSLMEVIVFHLKQ